MSTKTKLQKFTLYLDLIFWIIVVVATSVFGMVFSPTFWAFIAILALIESGLKLLRDK